MKSIDSLNINRPQSPGTSIIDKIGSRYWTTLLSDGTTLMRWIERGGLMYIDITLTPTGFAGAENNDWRAVGQ